MIEHLEVDLWKPVDVNGHLLGTDDADHRVSAVGWNRGRMGFRFEGPVCSQREQRMLNQQHLIQLPLAVGVFRGVQHLLHESIADVLQESTGQQRFEVVSASPEISGWVVGEFVGHRSGEGFHRGGPLGAYFKEWHVRSAKR